MKEDKDFHDMISLERERTCEFWLTDKYAMGYCRIVPERKCHYSAQDYCFKCEIFKAYNEGGNANRRERKEAKR